MPPRAANLFDQSDTNGFYFVIWTPDGNSLIAATALVHSLIMVTHNRTDFEKAGVTIVDPFAGEPSYGTV